MLGLSFYRQGINENTFLTLVGAAEPRRGGQERQDGEGAHPAAFRHCPAYFRFQLG
jgi:hypothetical protein